MERKIIRVKGKLSEASRRGLYIDRDENTAAVFCPPPVRNQPCSSNKDILLYLTDRAQSGLNATRMA